MKIQPIDIQIENKKENNWKFTHIALFVDQTTFLEDLYEGRKYFQVPEQLIPGSLVGEWLETAFEFEENNGLGQSRKRIDVRYPHVDQFVLKVLNKHKKSTMFSNVVRHALITGTVTQDDLPLGSANIQLIDQEKYALTYIAGTKIPAEYALMLTPETRLEDIKSAYTKYFRNFSKHYAEYANMHYGYIAPHVKSSIFDARRLYWQYQSGMGYTDIAKKEINSWKPGLDLDSLQVEARSLSSTIKKAVDRYKQALESTSIKMRTS